MLLVIIHHFTLKSRSKNIIALLKCNAEIVADWHRCLRNAMNRALIRVEIKWLAGPRKKSQSDETHFFKIPKHHIGGFNRTRNWSMVCVEEDTTLFYLQLIRKRARPELETTTNEFMNPGSILAHMNKNRIISSIEQQITEHVNHLDLNHTLILLFSIKENLKLLMVPTQTLLKAKNL